METLSEMEEFSTVRRPTIKPSTNPTGSHKAQVPDEEIKAIVASASHPQEVMESAIDFWLPNSRSFGFPHMIVMSWSTCRTRSMHYELLWDIRKTRP